MTYNVFGGMLNPAQSTALLSPELTPNSRLRSVLITLSAVVLMLNYLAEPMVLTYLSMFVRTFTVKVGEGKSDY